MEAFLLGFPTTVVHSLPLERLFGEPGATLLTSGGYSQFSEHLPAAGYEDLELAKQLHIGHKCGSNPTS